MDTIPSKYLNTNVRAMLSGGVDKNQPVLQKTHVLHLDKLFSFLKKSYRLEIKITKEDS